MANFQPLKDRFLRVLSDNIRLFHARGTFLDFGCGRGDVSEYLATLPSLTDGYAFDPSLSSDQLRQSGPRSSKTRITYTKNASDVPNDIDIAVLFDVIEHVPNTNAVLGIIHSHAAPRGWLFVTVPYNAHEWGIDDEFYGHLRRLSMRGIVALLENNQWNVIRVLDPTFPTFWFIRRAYLFTRRWASKPVQPDADTSGDDVSRSLISSRQSAWNTGGVIPRLLSGSLVPWTLIRRFDLYFESVYCGFELFVVCQKRTTAIRCPACKNGHFSFHKFFQQYSIQKCTYCSTERILPEKDPAVTETSDRDFVARRSGFRGVVLNTLAEYQINQRLRKTVIENRSALVVSRPPPPRAHSYCYKGWNVQLSDSLNTKATEDHVPRKYGIVALLHLFEHLTNLDDVISHIDNTLEPGGYLLLEFPNSRSLLKRLLGTRWFGYDPPYHQYVLDALSLSDAMGLKNYRLLEEHHFSFTYSLFVFVQSVINAAMPFQRDAMFSVLSGRRASFSTWVMTAASIPIGVLVLPLFIPYQIAASLLRAGCVVRQVYRRTDAQ